MAGERARFSTTGSVRVALDLPLEQFVAPLPELISQRTSEAVLSLPAQTFLELVREPGCPEVVKVGRLRLVDRVAFVAWLRRRAAEQAKPANDSAAAEVDPVEESFLARWGFKAKG